MTATSLKTHTLKDLAQLAKKHGIHGWHAMRKEQLVRALVRTANAKAARLKVTKKLAPAARRPSTGGNGSPIRVKSPTRTKIMVAPPAPIIRQPKERRPIKKLELAKAQQGRSKSLATKGSVPSGKDRLVAMVRGPYWLHAYWELTSQGVGRAQAAMGKDWHTARPMLRLLEVTQGGTATSAERVARDIEIHGGVTTWYIDVKEPPQSYRLEIGYLSASGRFFSLARSNVVSTPSPGGSDSLDAHWTDVAQDCDKIFAMSGGYSPDNASTELQELFEERLRRPMGSPMVTRYGIGAESLMPKDRDFEFEVDAELIIFGATRPDAHVTLQGEPVKLRPDGSFTVRFNMPNRRQVIPVVACSRDGVEQRTIVLAVERNTKAMEPLIRDSGE